MTESFSYVELIMQIRAQCPSFGRRIGAVSEFTELSLPGADVAVPYIFAVPVYMNGDDIDEQKGLQERHEVTGFIICVDNSGQKGAGGGERATSTVDSVRVLLEELETALLTWSPVNFRLKNVPRFLQRTTLGMNNERLWVQIDYQFDYVVFRNEFLSPILRDECAQHIAPADIVKLSMHYGLHREGEATVSWDDGWGSPATLPENDPTPEDKSAFDDVSTVAEMPYGDAVADENTGEILSTNFDGTEAFVSHGVEGTIEPE